MNVWPVTYDTPDNECLGLPPSQRVTAGIFSSKETAENWIASQPSPTRYYKRELPLGGVRTQDEVEAFLLKGLEGPRTRLTQGDWNAIRSLARERTQ